MANVWEAIKKHQTERAQAKQADEKTFIKEAAAGAKLSEPTGPTTRSDDDLVVLSVGGGKDYSQVLMVHHDRGGKITEQYRALRTSLLAKCSNERFCYLVTSADAGEGKTVTTLNLAMVMTERVDRRTIVVDCDLRKSKMASLLKAKSSPGLADLLRGDVKLEDAIQPTAYQNLSFLPAGNASQAEVAKLVGRPELEGTVNELRKQFDYVLFDTPPINIASDAGMLGRATGESLLVIRMNRTRRESVNKAVRLLRAANVDIAGVVLTHQKYYIPDYLYRYS